MRILVKPSLCVRLYSSRAFLFLRRAFSKFRSVIVTTIQFIYLMHYVCADSLLYVLIDSYFCALYSTDPLCAMLLIIAKIWMLGMLHFAAPRHQTVRYIKISKTNESNNSAAVFRRSNQVFRLKLNRVLRILFIELFISLMFPIRAVYLCIVACTLFIVQCNNSNT